MSWTDSVRESEMGRIFIGIVKIGIAPVIYALLSAISWTLTNVNLGGQTVNLQILVDIIKVFGPLGLLYSGLRDLGVKIF